MTALESNSVELLNWSLQLAGKLSECVLCGSVSKPPPGRGKEGRKMKSDKNSFHTLSANLFFLGCLLIASVIVMFWKYKTSQTGREWARYLTDAFLRK